jgi:protein-tyrosine phosphatase
VLDLTAPTPEQLDASTTFVREHARNGVVYVHCKAGYSRSAAVVGSHLIREGLAKDATEAAAILRARRPGIVLRPEVLATLDAQAAHGNEQTEGEDEGRTAQRATT